MHIPWCEKIDNYFEAYRILGVPLDGVTLRVRHSSREGICEYGQAMVNAFKKYGANIQIIKDLDSDLGCGHGKERLVNIDAFIMLAETTGVSAEALELAHLKDEGEPPLKDRLYVAMPKKYSDGFIRKRLYYHGVHLELYEDNDLKGGDVCLKTINKLVEMKRRRDVIKKAKAEEFKPKIGIVTALSIEYEAMTQLLEKPRTQRFVPRPGSLHEYTHGTLPAHEGGEHSIVVTQSGLGNNNASIMAQQLISDFDLDVVIMVGIAGGIPQMKKGNLDIRLGDVVVSGQMGVIQYDMIKQTIEGEEPNHLPRPPAAALLARATKLMRNASEMEAFYELLKLEACKNFKRPANKSDVLLDDSDPDNSIEIKRSKREKRSLVFQGSVGSANRVVKSHLEREELRKNHNLIAVEMESSGVADAAIVNGTNFFVIRGICDYANNGKNKVWQPFAAMAAAAFAATLIKSMPLPQSE